VTDRYRFVRQMLLAEIGESGQARFEGAVAHVAGQGLAHEIATAYATRAGLGTILPGAIDEAAWAPSFLESSAARALVAGSRAALASMRAALGRDAPKEDRGATPVVKDR
jgi:hypothetical protein